MEIRKKNISKDFVVVKSLFANPILYTIKLWQDVKQKKESELARKAILIIV